MISFRLLTYLSAASTYVLIVTGGFVTSTGSGTACPDWPLCHGQIIPPLTSYILIEYAHRLWTLVVTVLIIATFVSAYRGPEKPSSSRFLSTLSLLLLFAQVLLGALTVQTSSAPIVVTAHLALATGTFAVVVANAIYASQTPASTTG